MLTRASPASRSNPTVKTAEIVVHGVAAVCDPRGGLYLPETSTLVVSDLHLEKGAAFARRGMMLPPYDTIATLNMLAAVICPYLRHFAFMAAQMAGSGCCI